MNVFFEFSKIVQHLQAEPIGYALIGGVAVAFHAEPRFTRDIDLLVSKKDFFHLAEILKREDYFESASPWTFKNTELELRRFLKVVDRDEMIVDVLVCEGEPHEAIIRNALEANSASMGTVRVAAKDDLIWLKRQRNSKQDQADIERLQNEES